MGYGSIGQAVEARLTPFGAKFLRVARNQRVGVAGANQLDDLLGQADIVVLTAPLTSETKGLMDAKRIEKMKAWSPAGECGSRPACGTRERFCRPCREKEFARPSTLRNPESLPADHPLWKAPNLLLTPHVGGDSEKFMARAFQLIREQVQRFVKGEPLLNIVAGEY